MECLSNDGGFMQVGRKKFGQEKNANFSPFAWLVVNGNPKSLG